MKRRIHKEIYSKIQNNNLTPIEKDSNRIKYIGCLFSGDKYALLIEEKQENNSQIILLNPKYEEIRSIQKQKVFERVEIRCFSSYPGEKPDGKNQLKKLASNISHLNSKRIKIKNASQFICFMDGIVQEIEKD